MLRWITIILFFAKFALQLSFGQYFFEVGGGFNDGASIRCLWGDSLNNSLYAVAPGLNTAGGNPVYKIAKWNGNNWSGLNNPHGIVFSVIGYQGKIYFGCSDYLMVYDGTSWVSLSVHGVISKMKVLNGELFVVGTFDSIAGIPANMIARFDGSTWNNFPVLDPMVGYLFDVEHFGGKLYVSGIFYTPDSINCIAQLDGNTWRSLGAGLFGSTYTQIAALEVYNGNLVVGGEFKQNLGDPGNNIAAWDGSAWVSDFDGGTDAPVWSMHTYNGDLYAGGDFRNAGSEPCTYVARWRANYWEGLEKTFAPGSSIMTITDFEGSLYFAGGINWVGTDSVHQIVRYQAPPVLIENYEPELELRLFPNPAQGKISIEFNHQKAAIYSAQLFSMGGHFIREFDFSYSSQSIFELDVSGIPSGMYLLRVNCGEEEMTMKVIIENG